MPSPFRSQQIVGANLGIGSPPKKKQTLDTLVDLEIADPRIRRDAKILAKLRNGVYRNIRAGHASRARNLSPTLYYKYGGSAFPLRQENGHKFPMWRNLTPWLKLQLASLVICEEDHRPFKIHLHDDLRKQLELDGKDQRVYLRDTIKRQLRRLYGGTDLPFFFSVFEDRDKLGLMTRPHAHGVVQIRGLDVNRVTDLQVRRRLLRVETLQGTPVSRHLAGRWAVRHALRAASGIGGRRDKVALTGLDQSRNLWMGKPVNPIFNSDWVTYAFKNFLEVSPVLGENRLTLPYDLLGETKRFWSIIRD